MLEHAVKISMFGKFEILVNGEVVLSQLKQARKTRQFLEFILLRRDRPVTQEELMDVLWPESESHNPSSALRTLLHRYRSLVAECGITELDSSIITNRSSYQWNQELDCEVDIYRFEDLCREARSGILSRAESIDRLLKLMDIYIGPLLPESADEMWVVPKSVYYHDLFLECVFKLIELLKETDDYASVVQVCRRAIDIDVYDERLHMELMLALVKTGKNREALSQYQFATDLQYKELGLQPSEEIRSMYRLILEKNRNMESDIDLIQRSIEQEDRTDRGAFVCEYEIFKDIYQLQKRMVERYNSNFFIGLLTLSNTYCEDFDPLVQDSIMKHLLEITRTSLRRGDTVSRYSVAQYVLLLPSVTYDTGKIIMERIKKAFYSEFVKSSVMLSYKLRPLGMASTNPQNGSR